MTSQAADKAAMLSPYRVLDLTDERGLLCGKMLADLGADVIQIEPPGGSSARRVGPFHRDAPGADNGFFWWAYAANKRSITLDIARADGKALLERLAATAHFLIESERPGRMAAMGLSYDRLAEINPALIVVSITPFGQTGPYAEYAVSDLVGMGMGGFMYVTGDPDRAPVRVGVPHFYMHGSAAAAAGAMMAHAQRALTGEGQYVDVSCQESVARALANALAAYVVEGAVIVRQGSYRQTGADSFMRITWPCLDGFVNFQFSGGASSGASTNNFVRWMTDEGERDEYLASLDFTKMGYGMINNETLERIVPPVTRFLMRRTKQQLFEGAAERRILLFPVSTLGDILEYPQLEARGFFRTLEAPPCFGRLPADEDAARSAARQDVTVLGPFARASATPLAGGSVPPRVGEHNRDIYVGELGLDPAQLARLAQAGIV